MINVETNKLLHQIPSGVVASASNDHEHIVGEQKGSKGINQAVFQRLRKYPKLRMFLSECRSFFHRTYIVLTSRDTHRVPMGFVYLESPSGRLHANIRVHACTQDIERISSSRQWATPLDWAAYRDSWEAGAEWTLNSSDSSSGSEHKALLRLPG
jgi:hypothetical protein